MPALLVLLTVGCDSFVGEAEVTEAVAPAVAIVDANYVVLRPVSDRATSNSLASSVGDQTVYFDPADSIIDLRHFDPTTAVVEPTREDDFVVLIATTAEGSKLLGAWTSANLRKQLGVFVDGRLVSAPWVETTITSAMIIDGDFSKPEAEAVLARIRRGGAAV
jgi:preprotein translocase subunit SecD